MSGDFADRASALEELERETAIARVRGSYELRIGSHAFGLRTATPDRACVDCGDTIPVERLIAAPAARRCVDCQGLKEVR